MGPSRAALRPARAGIGWRCVLSVSPGPDPLTARHSKSRPQQEPDLIRLVVASVPVRIGLAPTAAVVTQLVAHDQRPGWCHPVDLAQLDRATPRGQPSTLPPGRTRPALLAGRRVVAPPGGRRDGTPPPPPRNRRRSSSARRHPDDLPARRGRALQCERASMRQPADSAGHPCWSTCRPRVVAYGRVCASARDAFSLPLDPVDLDHARARASSRRPAVRRGHQRLLVNCV